jgi:hypothetical protein
MERFNLKKIYEEEGKEQYWVEISNRFAALEILNDHVDINRTWKTYYREYQNSSQRQPRLLRTDAA